MLFRKSLHTLQGVLAAIGADPVVVDAVLCGEFLRRFLSEWPGRWFARPTSRSFSIRLSNVELTQLAMSGPITLARFWMDQMRDVAEVCGAACHEP
jgi:hypothetical protein